MVRKTGILLVIITTILFQSCHSISSQKSHYEEVDFLLQSGEEEAAVRYLQSVKDQQYSKKDRVLYYLDEGMLYRYAGEYEKSNESLTKAEYAIETLLTKSVSKEILSGVLNDNALDYSGEDYENIYINLFKALNYLHLNQTDEALIEIRRLNDKLNSLENKYSKELAAINSSEGAKIPDAEFNFYNDAMGRYLGLLAYRMDGAVDDARIERDYLEESFNTQPHIYDFNQPTLPAIDNSKTRVNILSFTGFSPDKYPETININTGFGSIYLESPTGDSTNSYLGFHTIGYGNIPNNISLKLQFPVLMSSFDPVDYVEVYVDGSYYGTMEQIESVNNVAHETFKVKQPIIVGKTVIRAVSKAIISEASQDAVTDEFGLGLGILTGLAGDIYMQVSENSDLRISRYFPGMIRGMEIELEPGVHDISLIYYDRHFNAIHQEDYINHIVKEGDLNLIESRLMRKL